MKSVKIKPEMNAVDVKNANIGVVKGDVDFVFKDCCPSKKEKELALSIKKKSEILFDQLLAGEITIEVYNAKIDAIHKGLSMVVYACVSNTEKSIDKNLSSIMSTQVLSINEAWMSLKQIEQSIE